MRKALFIVWLLALHQPVWAQGPGVIATLGPSASDPATMRGMIRRGMSVARINLSHANARSARKLSGALRQAAIQEGRKVPLLFDLPGGKVRMGTVRGAPVQLSGGQSFDLALGRRIATSAKQAYVNYRQLSRHVQPGDRLLLDDGRIVLRVSEVQQRRIKTQVEQGGAVRSRMGLVVKDKELPFPSMTAQDRRKLRIAVQNGANMIGVSFVQSPRNLRAVRRALDRLGAKDVKLVAKIESKSGLANLDSIIDHADAVMIARGDLGVAVGSKGLPRAQAEIAARCRQRGKPFIAATGFMSNMLSQPRPSAANLADVRRAVAQGPSYFMLNETAIGRHPVSTVHALRHALDRTGPQRGR